MFQREAVVSPQTRRSAAQCTAVLISALLLHMQTRPLLPPPPPQSKPKIFFALALRTADAATAGQYFNISRCSLALRQDLLALAESRSSSARKLSLAVLVAVLALGRGKDARGAATPDPALSAVLWFARSDGDATVRCSAFDSVAGYIGEAGWLAA